MLDIVFLQFRVEGWTADVERFGDEGHITIVLSHSITNGSFLNEFERLNSIAVGYRILDALRAV